MADRHLPGFGSLPGAMPVTLPIITRRSERPA